MATWRALQRLIFMQAVVRSLTKLGTILTRVNNIYNYIFYEFYKVHYFVVFTVGTLVIALLEKQKLSSVKLILDRTVKSNLRV